MTTYLDYAATCPMPPEVAQAYTEVLTQAGNPSSIHQSGQRQRGLVENSRADIAHTLGVDPMEVVFTSGGTESINTWIKGRTFATRKAGVATPVWLLTRAEHHATVDAVSWLVDNELAQVRFIEVDKWGVMDLGDLEAALGEFPAGHIAGVTTLVANNEVGSIQPIEQICRLAHDYGVCVHLDAIQALGHMDLPIRQWGVDALTISAHKVGGPVGIGALVVTRGAPALEGLHHGGGQQLHRSGTLDAAGAVGFAAALTRLEAHRHITQPRLAGLSARLRDELSSSIPGLSLSGHPDERVDHIVHATIDGCEGDVLLFLLDARGISVSTGSACQAGVAEPSHVLLAMGFEPAKARGALRFSLGEATTQEDISALLSALPDAVAAARDAGMANSA